VRLGAAFAIVLLAVGAGAAHAQSGAEPAKPRVFLDCRACDFDYLRREITWVDYVRDRVDADIHVLVTTESTGAGGRRYTMNFIGGRSFTGQTDTLSFTSPQTDTDDLRRRGVARTLKLGLIRYASGEIADALEVVYSPPVRAAGATAPMQRDRWNHWVFRAQLNGNMGGESTRANRSINGSFTANRTTEVWKITARTNGRYDGRSFTLSDGSELSSRSHSYGANGLLVRSVGGHMAVGLETSVSASTFSNTAFAIRFAPAVEYNLFPYAESTRRQFSFLYTVGVSALDYEEETIYQVNSETLYGHNLSASYAVQQPWGSAGASLTGSHLLHDLAQHRLEFDAGTSVRVIRGLSVNLNGNYSRIQDQRAIPRRNLSDEEVLLSRRAQQTSYRYRMSFGVSYSFGSIFNNVVNPRLSSGAGSIDGS
jgi:hypothetical protein